MSVVISGSVVLSDDTPALAGGGIINADNPLVGYRNLLVAGQIVATTEEEEYPASNLANPATHLRWQGLAGSPEADEYLTMDLQTIDEIDYIAIARHNFGSAQIPISIEVLNGDSPAGWDEIVPDVILPNDGPALFRFPAQFVTQIRVRLQPGTAAPTAAVIYVGRLLILQRRIYVGHTPINYGRRSKITNGRSESGNFLGRIVLNEITETGVELQNLTPDWYRAHLDPFISASREVPFFFAWRPGAYPYEVGYCWMTNEPQPQNQLANGMMQISLKMSGVV